MFTDHFSDLSKQLDRCVSVFLLNKMTLDLNVWQCILEQYDVQGQITAHGLRSKMWLKWSVRPTVRAFQSYLK